METDHHPNNQPNGQSAAAAVAASKADDSGIVVAILDLPVGSLVTCDGQTIRLSRNDFVGIHSIPNDTLFHLIVTRAGSSPSGDNRNAAATPVGFIVPTCHNQKDLSPIMALVKQFDPTTEEVSSRIVDDMTISNLRDKIHRKELEPQRLLSYQNIVSPEHATAWGNATNFISNQLLKARGIHPGSKIVPGCYGEEDELSQQKTLALQLQVEDGSTILYPPIPVLDSQKSARHSRHGGTKQFLARLPPAERTKLFLHPKPQEYSFKMILEQDYSNRWSDLLGELQLSYILFLHLHCLNSLEHWRDLVAMLSNIDSDGIRMYPDLYHHLLEILARQVTSIEEDFFEDMDMSGDNFLIPALQKLCQATSQIGDVDIQDARAKLCRILENRFRDAFPSINNSHPLEATLAITSMGTGQFNNEPLPMQVCNDNDEDDEESGPVVVSNEEIEASMARSSQSRATPNSNSNNFPEQFPPSLRKKYPVLFAAKMEHEDILMTCARALDDAVDVSLVREAGTFLVEEVEPHTTNQ